MIMNAPVEAASPSSVTVQPDGLKGLLGIPVRPKGLVIFAHGSGSGRLSPRNNHVADGLRAAGFATLLIDLLTPIEEQDRANIFDIPLLASRLAGAAAWARLQPRLAGLPIGYFGASTRSFLAGSTETWNRPKKSIPSNPSKCGKREMS